MDFYAALDARRTIRDFTEEPVAEETIRKVLTAAFKAPTNDHLRQLEFVVVRDRAEILRLTATVAANTEAIQQTFLKANAADMDGDEHAMFVDALPKQQRMLAQSGCLILPFFRQIGCPLCRPAEQSGLNYFASAWCALENIFLAAAAEGLACAFRIPIADESAHVKRLVGTPEGYELACFLTIGHPAPNAIRPRQKPLDPDCHIHLGAWQRPMPRV